MFFPSPCLKTFAFVSDFSLIHCGHCQAALFKVSVICSPFISWHSDTRKRLPCSVYFDSCLYQYGRLDVCFIRWVLFCCYRYRFRGSNRPSLVSVSPIQLAPEFFGHAPSLCPLPPGTRCSRLVCSSRASVGSAISPRALFSVGDGIQKPEFECVACLLLPGCNRF